MLSIKDVRRQRVRELIRDEFNGSQAEFAAQIQRADNYVSRMLSRKSGSKGIGEQMARHIEQMCGKPKGWLDGEPVHEVREPSTLYGQPITAEAAEIGREWDKLEEPVRTQIAALIHSLVAQQVRYIRARRKGGSDRPGASPA